MQLVIVLLLAQRRKSTGRGASVTFVGVPTLTVACLYPAKMNSYPKCTGDEPNPATRKGGLLREGWEEVIWSRRGRWMS